MNEDTIKGSSKDESGENRRRHPRQTVFKSAFLYPVLSEATLTVQNISHRGMSGNCALSLCLRQHVHISFDQDQFRVAEVRWIKGTRCGLMTEDPLLLPTGVEPLPEGSEALQVRDRRLPVSLVATLVVSAPVMVGTVRNISLEGMMIETGSQLPEGTQLLVKLRNGGIRRGRVKWSGGGMAGINFPGSPQKAESP